MDQIGTLSLAWSHGYKGSRVHYIDKDVVCYHCGRNVKFVNEDGSEKVFAFEGQGSGPITVHKLNRHFAMAEQCPDPKIFVYAYPSFRKLATLEGGAKLEFQQMEFSMSDYLLSLTGVPEFELVLWRYEAGEKLIGIMVGPTPPTSIKFNPANWRQICLTTEKSITVWQMEQADTRFVSNPNKVKLPPEDPFLMFEEDKERESHTRASTRMTKFCIEVPKAARAGLVGEFAENFEEVQDETPRVIPVSQAWNPQGDIYIGCRGGQLLKVDGEVMKAKVLYYPPNKAETPVSREVSHSKYKKMTSFTDPLPSKSEIDAILNNILLDGCLDCLQLHKKGLFAAGKDGVLRLLDVTSEEYQVSEEIRLGVPISSLTFAPSFMTMGIGSEMGCIHVINVADPNSLRILKDNHCGHFVGIGCLAFGAESVATVREGGEVQIWAYENGLLRSSINIGDQAVSMASSPLMHMIVVGSINGYLYFIDCVDQESPRIINRLRIARDPVRNIIFDEDGKYLLVSADDGHLFVVSGLASKNFQVVGYTGADGDVLAITTYTQGTKVRVIACIHNRRDYQGATKLILFDLTDEFVSDLPFNYNSLKKDFKDGPLNKSVLHLLIPSFGLALGEGNIIYNIADKSRRIQTFQIPAETHVDPSNPAFYLDAASQHPGHQLTGGHVLLSPHQRWLASFSPDGIVQLRTIGKMNEVLSLTTHDHREGGVKQVAFSEDCQRLFTVGHDGVLTCHTWQFTQLGLNKSSKAIEHAQAKKLQLLDGQRSEDDLLKAMPEWNPPPPTSKTPSEVLQEFKETQEAAKRAAMEKEEIYTTPTPIAAPDATWAEVQQVEALKEEDKEYEDTKKNLRMQIRDIRKTVQGMIKTNIELPDIQKLNRHDFDLDLDEQTRLQAIGDAEIQRVREEIELENLANLYCRELIKKECWDEMKVKGRSIQAFNSALEVANFPLRERSKQSLVLLETVSKRRRVEMAERQYRKEIEKSHRPSVLMEEEAPEGEEAEAGLSNPATTGSQGALYGGESELYYNQFELHTREQKIAQIVLLEDALYRIKVAFNKDFDEVFQKKEHEISKIQEKNKRIKKIMEDLDIKEPIVNPALGICEKPEMLLEVKDSEITVEKYLTPEQRKKLEELERLEEERRARERGDNARERALEMMMGGVLEIRKEDELKKDVPVPLFMTQKAPETFNEEEKKLAQEYEKKVKELNEEREKFRKQLETELRKLQGVIAEGMAAFDETLTQLFMKKIKVQIVLYQEELKILRLRLSLLQEEEYEIREKELSRMLEHKKHCKLLSLEAVNESRKHVEAFRDEYEQLVAEDKVLDKSFKRDFNDVSSLMVDQLYRLFRRRPRITKLRGMDTPAGETVPPNPFWDRPSSARQNAHMRMSMLHGLDELDKEVNMPEGLEPYVWHRMCKYRREKVEKEMLIKQKALTLAEMNAFMQKRQEEDDILKAEIDDILSQINKLKEDRLRATLNMEVQLLLKQGQVEVDAGDFVHDYTESVLINRTVVEDLNGTIKQLGESKIASMVESKDFRKGIIQLEWEHRKMLMQMDDYKKKMKDIQFMKVTREIQSFLNEADYEAKKNQEIATLEQTILLQRRLHDKKLTSKQRKFKELGKSMKHREVTNTKADTKLRELNVCVNERREIEEVNAEKRRDTGAERRYQEIVQRRKLVDLAKAQAQEVAVLRAEVERLRMRTFPALVQVEQ